MSRRKKTLDEELRDILSPGFVLDLDEKRILVFKNDKWIDLSDHGLMKAFAATVPYLRRWDWKTKSGFWYI